MEESSAIPKISNNENNEVDNLFQILGFTKLIQDEIEKRENHFQEDHIQTFDQIENESTYKRKKIRCMCNDDVPKSNTNLIQCQVCQNFLHESCMRDIQYDTNNLICPICRLSERGIDQFSELKEYIKFVEQEIKTIHDLVNEANSIEQDYLRDLKNKSASSDPRRNRELLQAKIQEIQNQNEAFLNKTINYIDREGTTSVTEQSESADDTNTDDQESIDSSEPST